MNNRRSSALSGSLLFAICPYMLCMLIVTVLLGLGAIPPSAQATGGGGGGGGHGGAPSMSTIRQELMDKWKQEQEQQRKLEEEFKELEEDAGTFLEDSGPSPTPPPRPARRPKPKPKPKPVKLHPENGESDIARQFLTEQDLGIDPALAEDVWTDPRSTQNKYKQAVRKAKRSNDRGKYRDAVVDYGHVHYLLGLFGDASEQYMKALDLIKPGEDPDSEAFILNNIGAVRSVAADYGDARQHLDDALSRFSDSGNDLGRARTLNNLAVMAKNRGMLNAAVSYFREGLKIDGDSPRGRMRKLINLGRTYTAWGQYKEALEVYDEALEIARSSDDETKEADILLDRGETFRAWGKQVNAIDSYKNALKKIKLMGAEPYRANNLIGTSYLDQGDIERAAPYLKAGKYNSGLGRLHLMKGEYDSAEKYYENLLKSAKKYDIRQDRFTALTGLGIVYEESGNLSKAEKSFAEAMDIAEDMRADLLLSERRNFFAVPINGFLPAAPAKGLIRVRLKRDRGSDTIRPAETIRARTFSDMIAQRADLKNADVPKELLLTEEKLFNEVAALRKAAGIMPRQRDRNRFDNIVRELRNAEKAVRSFEQSLWEKHKRYASARFPRPIDLDQAAIKPDEYVLVYDLVEEGVAIRVIKGKKVVRALLEKTDVDRLKDNIERFRSCFETVQLRRFDDDLGKRLYRRLLAKALEEIPEGTPIMIVPDGVLALLPFEALVTEGVADWKTGEWGPYPEGLTYVGDRYPVTYRQSVTALTLERNLGKKPADTGKLLVLADPVFEPDDERFKSLGDPKNVPPKKVHYVKLMDAVRENAGSAFRFPRLEATGELASYLNKVFGQKSDVFTGMDATKELFVSKLEPDLSQFRWIVFATHAFAGNNMPGIMEPFMALTLVPKGTDGFLTMTDVLALRLEADLVALTACQTGYGQHLPGEGIMSLGRAFLLAGSKAALMSLWSVSEASSVRLVEKFFRHLKEGNNKLLAWQIARAELKQEGFQHPFFWASFVLVGEVY